MTKAKSFLFDASTRFSMFTFKFAAGNDAIIITVASTEPSRVTPCSFADRPDGNQSSKSNICDIYPVGHRAAPIGSWSSGRTDVPASVLLRTIAWG